MQTPDPWTYRLVALLAAVAGLMTGGCGVTFRFGPGPTRPARMSAFERCVFEHRLVLRPASASYTKGLVVAGGKVSSPAGRGYTFYRGTRRLDAERALKLLGDPGLEADYLAQGVVSLMLILSTRRVIMGGGVMKQQQVFPKLRRRALELLNRQETKRVPHDSGDTGTLVGVVLAQSP